MIGSWEFVRAAYLVAYGSLALYTGSLFWRANRALHKPHRAELDP